MWRSLRQTAANAGAPFVEKSSDARSLASVRLLKKRSRACCANRQLLLLCCFSTQTVFSPGCAVRNNPDFADIFGQVTQLLLGQKLHAAAETEFANRDCEILGRTGSCEKCGKGIRDCIRSVAHRFIFGDSYNKLATMPLIFYASL